MTANLPRTLLVLRKLANVISFVVSLTLGTEIASDKIVSNHNGKHWNRRDKNRYGEEDIDHDSQSLILVRSSQCCEDV